MHVQSDSPIYYRTGIVQTESYSEEDQQYVFESDGNFVGTAIQFLVITLLQSVSFLPLLQQSLMPIPPAGAPVQQRSHAPRPLSQRAATLAPYSLPCCPQDGSRKAKAHTHPAAKLMSQVCPPTSLRAQAPTSAQTPLPRSASTLAPPAPPTLPPAGWLQEGRGR
jgi:hypothetical protein